MQMVRSLTDTFELLRHASLHGTIKAVKAYIRVNYSEVWIPRLKLMPPYPPNTSEKKGKVKTVRLSTVYNGKQVVITGWRFWETFLAAKEVFVEKEYDWLDVSGRKVLDLGAFTGDSAVSFAMRGASEVYTCEPNPNMISIIHYNVSENGYQDKIKVLHCFVGGKISANTDFYFDNQNMVNRSTGLKLHKLHDSIPVTTLDKLTKEYGINDGCLKMDIEGAEYEVISMAPLVTLKKFRQIQLDFHKIDGKNYETIKKRLEKAGFDCEVHFVGTFEGGYINAINTYR